MEKIVNQNYTAEDLKSYISFYLKSQCPPNCFDCNRRIPALMWFSLPYGIGICLECAGSHRCLGTHISFVRSYSLDSWNMQQLMWIIIGGPQRAHQMFDPMSIKQRKIGQQNLEWAQQFYGSSVLQDYKSKLHKEYDILIQFFSTIIRKEPISKSLELLSQLPRTERLGCIIFQVLLKQMNSMNLQLVKALLQYDMYPQDGYFSPLKAVCGVRGDLSCAILFLESGKIESDPDFYLQNASYDFIQRLKFHFAWKLIRLLIIGHRDKTCILNCLSKDTLNYIISSYLKIYSLTEIY